MRTVDLECGKGHAMLHLRPIYCKPVCLFLLRTSHPDFTTEKCHPTRISRAPCFGRTRLLPRRSSLTAARAQSVRVRAAAQTPWTSCSSRPVATWPRADVRGDA
ncbi:Hypothetical predicted protein [Cloeon dipterum]|uniref:Uncharacterized protein n=1 Tax=Cloeon dipterum TaxID=197152 RepID=A0A8S1DS42_9INSE|nr:Hypothetical predicted protein [Cloeon dipterum]